MAAMASRLKNTDDAFQIRNEMGYICLATATTSGGGKLQIVRTPLAKAWCLRLVFGVWYPPCRRFGVCWSSAVTLGILTVLVYLQAMHLHCFCTRIHAHISIGHAIAARLYGVLVRTSTGACAHNVLGDAAWNARTRTIATVYSIYRMIN